MFVLSCESTVDLTLRHLQERNISAIAYTYIIDGKEYFDDMREGDGLQQFYAQLVAGKQPSTSLINVDRYAAYFRTLLQQGDALHITFSSGLSQSASNAAVAAELVQKEFPRRKLFVVDSLCASVGYGLFVDTLADLRDKGKSIEDVRRFASDNRNRLVHQFYSTTLTYFRRSGRVSGPAALIGNLLKLCPIMQIDGAGKIVAYTKVMSETKAIDKTLAEISRKIENGTDYDGKLWVGHSDYISSADKVAQRLKELYSKADVRIFDIGPVIASHCGPGTLAVFFWGDKLPG